MRFIGHIDDQGLRGASVIGLRWNRRADLAQAGDVPSDGLARVRDRLLKRFCLAALARETGHSHPVPTLLVVWIEIYGIVLHHTYSHFIKVRKSSALRPDCLRMLATMNGGRIAGVPGLRG